MASPQTENGYTKIANELYDQIVKTAILGSEYQLLFFVIRKTYGFNKKEDRISLTQFEKGTGLSRATVNKGLKNLVLMKLLVKTAIPTYSINKDWETWLVKTAKLVKHNDPTSIARLTKNGIARYTHKRKKEITKEITVGAAKPQVQELLAYFYKNINPNINFGNKTERQAADWLISKYGYDKVLAATQYAASVQTDKYAPTITTPYQLKEKMAALVKFKNGKKGKIWKSSTSALRPFQREVK